MADPTKEDRTARAIRERRERAKDANRTTGVPVSTAPAFEGIARPPLKKGLDEARRKQLHDEIERLKDRPVLRARQLAQYQTEGLSQEDIAQALGVRQPWVSKRIALGQAPPEVLQQIESGSLSENYYYNNRAEVEQRLTGATHRLQRDRPIPITITLDAGRALTEILEQLAREHQCVPIRLDAKASKAEITEILNRRAVEIQQLVVKKE